MDAVIVLYLMVVTSSAVHCGHGNYIEVTVHLEIFAVLIFQ